jgi:hypothetical protein
VHFPTHLILELWRQADSQYPPANFLEARFWTANEALTDARITSALPTIRQLSNDGLAATVGCIRLSAQTIR